MRRVLIIAFFGAALALSAFGLSTEIPVTPSSLDQGTFLFSVTNNVIRDGVSFHVTITGKNRAIPTNSSVGLCIATHWTNGSQILPAEPRTPVTLKKDERLWKVDFIASSGLLTNADLCLVFTVQDYATTKDGKRIPMPSCDFYEIKLRDFLKP